MSFISVAILSRLECTLYRGIYIYRILYHWMLRIMVPKTGGNYYISEMSQSYQVWNVFIYQDAHIIIFCNIISMIWAVIRHQTIKHNFFNVAVAVSFLWPLWKEQWCTQYILFILVVTVASLIYDIYFAIFFGGDIFA